MIIKRDKYLQELISGQGNGLVKVITGIRRAGKSFLVFTLFRNHLISNGVKLDHIFEMSFDVKENEKYCDSNVFYQYVKNKIVDDGLPFYVLLDEVQLLDDFESVLNGLVRMSNVDVYVTGSNAKFLSRDIITEFRGRGDEIYLQPLSFSEFMSAYKGNKYDGWNEYIMYGGLPPVVLETNPAKKVKLLKSLLSETYLLDIMGRHRIRNKSEFEELIKILASGVGSFTNPSKLSDTFRSVKKVKISKNTIASYISYLEDSFIIEKAQRYDIKGRKYIDSPFKFYFTDIGLRNAETNFRQIEETHIMENVIFNELISRGFQVDVGIVELFEKNAAGKKTRKSVEIDFVCNSASKRYYIQSAFALPDMEKAQQEARPLLRTGDVFKKIIIVKDTPAPHYTDEGILVMSIYYFLLNDDSLKAAQ